jgi:hypothetical protein
MFFSTAGLTIAKDHARLASETANELIFLHDAIPAIWKFHEAERLERPEGWQKFNGAFFKGYRQLFT